MNDCVSRVRSKQAGLDSPAVAYKRRDFLGGRYKFHVFDGALYRLDNCNCLYKICPDAGCLADNSVPEHPSMFYSLTKEKCKNIINI